MLSPKLLVSAPAKFTVTGALWDQLLLWRNMFRYFHFIKFASVWDLCMLPIHCTGWHINNSWLHQARNRSQLRFPGWYCPGDTASQSQTHCPAPLPTSTSGKAGRYPDASQRCSRSLSASSVSSISNFFLGPGNSTFFANSTHRTALIKAL